MLNESDADPIEDNELLYRRIPAANNWYTDGSLSPQAYGPHKDRDKSGLSVFRAKFVSIQSAARGRPGKAYFVAVLKAIDLRSNGIDVVPRPDADFPGHAEIPNLRAENRNDDLAKEMMIRLSKLHLQIEGPFTTPNDSPSGSATV